MLNDLLMVNKDKPYREKWRYEKANENNNINNIG